MEGHTKMKIQIVSLVLFGIISCQSGSDHTEVTDTPTRGTLTVACDESLQPIMEAEAMVFQGLYPEAKIQMVYRSEGEAIDLFLADSARLAIVTRDLFPEELSALKEQKISRARYHKLGYDAVAFILNPINTDTSFSLKQIQGLLAGSITDWSQIRKENKLGPIHVVFDHSRSGAIRLMKDSVLKGQALGKNCFALKSNPAVIDYVMSNPAAIGIIGVSWISDTDDVQSFNFLKGIKVAEVEPILMRVAGITNKPIQGNIALKQYPYWRLMRVISREMRTGLGTGFASFIESEPGQKVILKGGLVPFRSSIRTITISD